METQNIRRRNAELRRKLKFYRIAAFVIVAVCLLASFAMALYEQKQVDNMAALTHEYNAALLEMQSMEAQHAMELEQMEQERIAAYHGAGYVYIGECSLTAYCCERYAHICGTGDGITATGLPVEPGMCAVDPTVIPLGSTVIINGMSYLAADVGGAIKGNRIDIVYSTHLEALQFGRQSAEVWIIPPA